MVLTQEMGGSGRWFWKGVCGERGGDSGAGFCCGRVQKNFRGIFSEKFLELFSGAGKNFGKKICVGSLNYFC
jgi:hypothetical protein